MMKFDKYLPREILNPFIKHYVVSESGAGSSYKVFPSTGLVTGFQYKGTLTSIADGSATMLSSAGVTGISDSYKLFANSANTGTVLVYFTETGFAHFASRPVNELFNLSISLGELFSKESVSAVEERLASADDDQQRIKIVEQFFVSLLKDIQADKLVVEAVQLIYNTKGSIRVKELTKKLFISQSPFEKRFRKIVGTTPKKFASIVRFNTVLQNMDPAKSLTQICYDNNFFDQAHFTKDFKRYTGETPEQFKGRK
jgi:AraC-like DNA-binding protein